MDLMFLGRSKYIIIKFHYIIELVKYEEIKLEFSTSKDGCRYFTKPLIKDERIQEVEDHDDLIT